MLTKETYVRARVDVRLKRDTEHILNGLGMTTTEAIRLFLHQIRIHQGLPFSLKLKKEDNTDILRSSAARQAALDSVYDD